MKTLKLLVIATLLVGPASVWAQWTYKKHRDEMRESVSIQARTTSTNAHQFSFPYSGGSRLSLLVWRHPDTADRTDDIDVALVLDRGQFRCADDCRIRMRVNDDEVESFIAEGTDKPGLIWIADRDSTRFLMSLSGGTRAIIEVPVYQHGERQFKFSVSRLSWPK